MKRIHLFCIVLIIGIVNCGWDRISGESTVNLGGDYANLPYYPGPRVGAAYFTKDITNPSVEQKLYLFGGYGCTNITQCSGICIMINATINETYCEYEYGYLNDMWVYDTLAGPPGTWTQVLPNLTPGLGMEINQKSVHYLTQEFTHSNMHWPAGRAGAAVWDRKSTDFGSMFMFGGIAYHKHIDFNGTMVPKFGYLNELWTFHTNFNNWAFLGGSDYYDTLSQFQGIGIANVTMPGGRTESTSWYWSGAHYLFGGYGFGSVPPAPARLCDLWKFTIITTAEPPALFEFVKGPGTANEITNYITWYDPWATPGGRSGAIGWVIELVDPETEIPDGLLYLYGGTRRSGLSVSDVWVYSVNIGSWKWENPKFGLQTPMAREDPILFQFLDTHQSYAFIFGGYSKLYSDQSLNYPRNDFWSFYVMFNQWQVMHQSCCGQNSGVISGNQGHSYPGYRRGSVAWVLGSTVYLFGGEGFFSLDDDGNMNEGRMNDFWTYSFDSTYAMPELAEQLGGWYYVLFVLFGGMAFVGVGLVILGVVLCIAWIVYEYKKFEKEERLKEGVESGSTGGDDVSGSGEGSSYTEEETELV